MNKTYAFDPDTKVITLTITLESQDDFELKPYQPEPILINLANDTIYQNEMTTPLDESHMYLFLDAMANIVATKPLMDALLASKYYTDIYLSCSLGVFNTPVDGSYFFMFSSFILPYEVLYRELELRSAYATAIIDAYDKNHNVLIRKLKEFVRLVLVIPGLVCTPLILLMVLPALNRMT